MGVWVAQAVPGAGTTRGGHLRNVPGFLVLRQRVMLLLLPTAVMVRMGVMVVVLPREQALVPRVAGDDAGRRGRGGTSQVGV